MRFFMLSIILIFLLACQDQNEEYDHRFLPTDYLWKQRSYPYDSIDVKAYKKALAEKQNAFPTKDLFANESWNNIGPYNLAGRVTDIEVDPRDDQHLYVGSASGGIYESSNGGEDWTAIFDEAGSLAIGDLAIDQNNPDIIYVGTGEANGGGGSLAYDGDGVYKSEDAGRTWRHLGLIEVGSIGKVILDPNNSDIVYVAAMGHLFSDNPDRGIYKSEDGGETWQKVLFVNDCTGGIDMAIHPQNGNLIYAAMWERKRRPFGRQYGGANTNLYRSTDGGLTWQRLTNGLPTDPESKSRIGIALSESHPDILYLYYVNQLGYLGSIYKSEDGGDSWQDQARSGLPSNSFMWWYGKIYVHPEDPNRVYATALHMYRSDDGAQSWRRIFTGAHVDHHAMAFSKQNSNLVYNGNDGGVYQSIDDGDNINFYLPEMSNFQFYTCKIDPHNVDRVYGGSQDNGTVMYNSDEFGWDILYGGDGFSINVDPIDPDRIYVQSQFGNVVYFRNGPFSFPVSAVEGVNGDFNWNTPFIIDPNNNEVLYTGTQELYRSIDRAQSWSKVSPELVNGNNPVGNLNFGTLTTIDVSTLNSDIIYVGTDDGNVWVSKDFGVSYENISESLPERWVTKVHHDPHNESGVYLTISGYRFGESSAQVYYSDNYGSTWQNIGAGLPDVPVNDIVVDKLEASKIYVATDIGVFFSLNNGQSWETFGKDLPNVPVIDLDLHDSNTRLAAGTYGRGMYIYDLPVLSSIENNLAGLYIYPNPTYGQVNIKGIEDPAIKVFDSNGHLVIETRDSQFELPQELLKGVYIIELIKNNRRYTQRIVKL